LEEISAPKSKPSSRGKTNENSLASGGRFADFALVFTLLDLPGENADDDPGTRSIFLKKFLSCLKIEVVETAGMNTSAE